MFEEELQPVPKFQGLATGFAPLAGRQEVGFSLQGRSSVHSCLKVPGAGPLLSQGHFDEVVSWDDIQFLGTVIRDHLLLHLEWVFNDNYSSLVENTVRPFLSDSFVLMSLSLQLWRSFSRQ
jgi:hypothetical protein